MRKLLVTGGTAFVSRYTAEYFLRRGDEVYVLNRGTRPQSEGVIPIIADRHALGDTLRGCRFDAIIDVTCYTREDAADLLDALGDFGDYVLISSSAVYPETLPQPFHEDMPVGANSVWGAYGTDKIAAEEEIRRRVPGAYILRPPYIYGPMQNVYREPFVFDCAAQGIPFRLPGDGSLPLQFLHVDDLCRFMDLLLTAHPAQRGFNVGNLEIVTAREWAALCYEAAGVPFASVSVGKTHPQRSYFPFHDYAYRLDVTAQQSLMPETIPLAQGLREAYLWYAAHPEDVKKRAYLTYIKTSGI